MQINITSKQLGMTKTLEEYINAKASKLTRYFDQIEQIDVKIEKAKHGFSIEIVADVEHYDVIVSNSDNELPLFENSDNDFVYKNTL